MFFAAASGVLAGMLHVISGPDHLTAVAPLAARQRAVAWIAGLRWGLGHSAGVAVVAAAAMLLRPALPLAAVSPWAEKLVGIMLIGIGVWSLRLARTAQLRPHPHPDEGPNREHWHWHAPGAGHSHAALRRQGRAAFGIGTLHGLAGSSHFVGVLPSLAFPTAAESALYLAGFAGGTVAAMMLFSGAVGWLAARWAGDGGRTMRGVHAGCGLAALGVGGWWLATGGV